MLADFDVVVSSLTPFLTFTVKSTLPSTPSPSAEVSPVAASNFEIVMSSTVIVMPVAFILLSALICLAISILAVASVFAVAWAKVYVPPSIKSFASATIAVSNISCVTAIVCTSLSNVVVPLPFFTTLIVQAVKSVRLISSSLAMFFHSPLPILYFIPSVTPESVPLSVPVAVKIAFGVVSFVPAKVVSVIV